MPGADTFFATLKKRKTRLHRRLSMTACNTSATFAHKCKEASAMRTASRKSTRSPAARQAANSPIAWFAMLERGRQTGNRALVSGAARELARLGVVVTFMGVMR